MNFELFQIGSKDNFIFTVIILSKMRAKIRNNQQIVKVGRFNPQVQRFSQNYSDKSLKENYTLNFTVIHPQI